MLKIKTGSPGNSIDGSEDLPTSMPREISAVKTSSDILKQVFKENHSFLVKKSKKSKSKSFLSQVHKSSKIEIGTSALDEPQENVLLDMRNIDCLFDTNRDFVSKNYGQVLDNRMSFGP